MTINSASDAKRFSLLSDEQLVASPEEALISGRYNVANIVSAFKRENIRNNNYDVPTYEQFVMMSKNYTARPDTGLSGYSDEEISKLAHDKSLSPSERRRFQTEEKVRGLRNKQKRQDYNKKKGNGNSNKIVLPDPDELYGLDNFKEAVDNLYVGEMPVNQPSFWDVLGGSAIMTASGVAIAIIVADDVTGIGTVDDSLLGPLIYTFEQGLQMAT